MNRISAAENLVIMIEPGQWRLLTHDELNTERPILEASTGNPLRYANSFASTRRLPPEGMLPADYVRQVIVGWSAQDESWHLGLLLGQTLADQRGSRWCEIAHWPDPDQTVFIDLAQEAGRGLARTLGCPLNVIPARPPEKAPPPPPPPLRPLPITWGMWKLENNGDSGLHFVRSRRWVTSRLLRGLWYAFWVVVYVLLSLATLGTDLALPNAGTMLPNPELLPYLGLVAAVILVGMICFIIIEIATTPNRIIIDAAGRSIAALRGSSEHWRLKAGDLQSVYVTEIISKKGRKRVIHHAELNLHLGGGRFKHVLRHTQQEEAATPISDDAHDGVLPLTPFTVKDDLQTAGLYVAEALGGVACWYDQRLR